jgi:hypothetical protein
VVAKEALKVAVAQERSVSGVAVVAGAEDSREVVVVSEGHGSSFDIRVCSSWEPQRRVNGSRNWRKELRAADDVTGGC